MIIYKLQSMDQKNKFRLLNCCFGVCTLIGLALAITGLFVLDGLIISLAQDNIKMGEDTYKLWGQMPGQTETITIRNCTLYNFQNPDGFLYRQEKPIFTQKSNYVFEEQSKFVNYNYVQNQRFIDFDYWLHFEIFNTSRNVNDTHTLINLAPLGFWFQLESVPIYTFTLQGFGGLFIQLNETLIQQTLGQAVSLEFLPTYPQFQLVCNNLGISQKFCSYLWQDSFYGINNQGNVQIWVKAAYLNDLDSKNFLFKYFSPFPKPQFEGLLQEFREWSEAILQIVSNWYCDGTICQSFYLSVAQLSQSMVTNSPPAGQPAQSICSLNNTCIGSPQIPTFLHHEFKQKYPDEKYQQLTFSIESVSKLFYAYEGLLNIGTLKNIFTIGEAYDNDKSEQTLSDLKQVLGMETNDHAFVVWEWIKYMTNDFVLKSNKEGTRKIAGLGGLFSQAFYQVTYQFSQWYIQDLLGFLTFQTVGNCSKYLEDNFSFLTPTIITNICQNVDPKNYSTYYSMIKPCIGYSDYEDFRKSVKMSSVHMEMYCDIDESPSYMGELLIDFNRRIKQKYDCTQSKMNKCNQIDIIIKQTFFSQITMNPWDNYPFPKNQSVHQWNSDIPRFQYQEYLRVAHKVDSQNHTEAQMRALFNFDMLLSGPTVQELFLQKNQTEFKKKYLWDEPSLLRNYIRFGAIEVGLGGLVQERTTYEWFFGYTDPFLAKFKDTDTMKGGDPSINPVVMLNQPNSTVEQAVLYPQTMYTGFGDGDIPVTRNYHKVYQKTYIAYNKTYFDGEDIVSEFVSPWTEKVEIKGSDGFQNPPHMDDDEKCFVYLSTLCRFGSLYFNTTRQKYGMELHDMRLSPSFLQSRYENKENEKYYQGYNGFLNLSFQGFPAYFGKNHFLDAPANWSNLVDIYDESQKHKMTANQWDDSYIFLQPYTGASFSATIFLQSNYHYVPDILFPESEVQNSTIRMLPMFSVYRSGNISESVVDDYFGILRTAINAKVKLIIIGFVIIGLMGIICCIVRHTTSLKNTKKQSLLESEAEAVQTRSV